MVSELGPNFDALFKANRGYMVHSVLLACLNLKTSMKEACKFLSEALQVNREVMVFNYASPCVLSDVSCQVSGICWFLALIGLI